MAYWVVIGQSQLSVAKTFHIMKLYICPLPQATNTQQCASFISHHSLFLLT